MQDLIEAKNTLSFLKEHGISAKKKYGQNFLIDKRVLDRIIEGAGISGEDTVLEIGPGIGTLTQALCLRAGKVIAVEIDKDMIPLLQENLSGLDNYEIINEDILKLDLKEMFGASSSLREETDFKNGESTGGLKVVANLPYYITTPIIIELLESGAGFDSITVMVQKEVAERMQAGPGGKDYGALTLLVRHYSEAEVIANVPPNSFIPRPGVDSAVIKLSLLKKPRVETEDPGRLFAIIRAAFSQRRKTLSNALKNDAALKIPREKTEEALETMGLKTDIRGERLSLEEFAELSRLIR